MNILSLETSCDETAAAVVVGSGERVTILANTVGRQTAIHRPHGGVVPELAARRHATLLIPVIKEALAEAQCSFKNIDALAVTRGPGLMVALTTGVATARSLSFALKKPLIGVNHLEGHIYSLLGNNVEREVKNNNGENNKGRTGRNDTPQTKRPDAQFFNKPFVALIVSGGHTELILVRGYGDYVLIGKTRDDAAGEAFDKVAKMIGLSYPGGPAISKVASRGGKRAFDIPRPMIDSDDFDFSFSGIKTHVRYLVETLKKKDTERDKKGLTQSRERSALSESHIADIAASFEDAIAEVLVTKTIRAAKVHNVESIAVVGGVAANSHLQETMRESVRQAGMHCYFPDPGLTGDNAAMIGIAAYLKYRSTGEYDDVFSLSADPNLKLYRS